MTEVSQQIYKILTKRRYNRAEPYLEAGLEQAIKVFVSNGEPIKLVGFWGTGPKSEPNAADLASCEFLDKLNGEVKAIYAPGIEFTFIFATMHGFHNGYEKNVVGSYAKGMEGIFNQFGFRYIYLDDLWQKYGISFEKIDEIYASKEPGWWDKVENREVIENNAEKRNKRLSPQIAAQKYFIMRDLEKEMLEKEFSGYIFHAFSDPVLKNVLPHMPTLYFYSSKGWSDTPWFVIDR